MGFKEIIIKIINVYGHVDFSWNVSRDSLILFSCCQLCTISWYHQVGNSIRRNSTPIFISSGEHIYSDPFVEMTNIKFRFGRINFTTHWCLKIRRECARGCERLLLQSACDHKSSTDGLQFVGYQEKTLMDTILLSHLKGPRFKNLFFLVKIWRVLKTNKFHKSPVTSLNRTDAKIEMIILNWPFMVHTRRSYLNRPILWIGLRMDCAPP